jgi:glycerol kinase
VDRPVVTETTALGAAYLAGLGVGLYASLESIAEQWRCERGFSPALAEPERQKRYQGWRDAVARVCQTSRGAN